MAQTDRRTSDFVPGLDLAQGFFEDAVAPILTRTWPSLSYSAGLIGAGSEVLGFDDCMSTDHHWGPRVMLFLEPEILAAGGRDIHVRLAQGLPHSYGGYPTHWSEPDPGDRGVQKPHPTDGGPVNHRVEMDTVNGFLRHYLGIIVTHPMGAPDWLTIPWQKLRSITAGRIFRDDLGLEQLRDRLRWYPHDIWLYLLASCWARIGEEEHLTGRAGLVGDEVGAALIASRLVRDAMRLAFLMEQTYPPYAKWFGTAFAQLRCAGTMAPLLDRALRAGSWQERDPLLAQVFRQLACMHNRLGITPALDPEPAPFWSRPFTVIRGERFADALREAIRGTEVKRLAGRRLIGNIDLLSDSTDLLEDPSRQNALAALWENTD